MGLHAWDKGLDMRKLTFRLPDGQEYTIEVKLENDEYWWTEGNGGCDCNREIEINRQHPNFPLDLSILRCGDTIELIRVDPPWELDERNL